MIEGIVNVVCIITDACVEVVAANWGVWYR